MPYGVNIGGAKDETPWPVLRQVTPTNSIAGPLGKM